MASGFRESSDYVKGAHSDSDEVNKNDLGLPLNQLNLPAGWCERVSKRKRPYNKYYFHRPTGTSVWKSKNVFSLMKTVSQVSCDFEETFARVRREHTQSEGRQSQFGGMEGEGREYSGNSRQGGDPYPLQRSHASDSNVGPSLPSWLTADHIYEPHYRASMSREVRNLPPLLSYQNNEDYINQGAREVQSISPSLPRHLNNEDFIESEKMGSLRKATDKGTYKAAPWFHRQNEDSPMNSGASEACELQSSFPRMSYLQNSEAHLNQGRRGILQNYTHRDTYTAVPRRESEDNSMDSGACEVQKASPALPLCPSNEDFVEPGAREVQSMIPALSLCPSNEDLLEPENRGSLENTIPERIEKVASWLQKLDEDNLMDSASGPRELRSIPCLSYGHSNEAHIDQGASEVQSMSTSLAVCMSNEDFIQSGEKEQYELRRKRPHVSYQDDDACMNQGGNEPLELQNAPSTLFPRQNAGDYWIRGGNEPRELRRKIASLPNRQTDVAQMNPRVKKQCRRRKKNKKTFRNGERTMQRLPHGSSPGSLNPGIKLTPGGHPLITAPVVSPGKRLASKEESPTATSPKQPPVKKPKIQDRVAEDLAKNKRYPIKCPNVPQKKKTKRVRTKRNKGKNKSLGLPGTFTNSVPSGSDLGQTQPERRNTSTNTSTSREPLPPVSRISDAHFQSPCGEILGSGPEDILVIADNVTRIPVLIRKNLDEKGVDRDSSNQEKADAKVPTSSTKKNSLHDTVLASDTSCAMLPGLCPYDWFIVVDTNVLLADLKYIQDLLSFHMPGVSPPILVIPWHVLVELDSLKRRTHPIAKKARKAITFIEMNLGNHPRLRGQSMESANTQGAAAFANMQSSHVPGPLPDDFILACALTLSKETHRAILVSNDHNLCNKALANHQKACTVPDLLELLQTQCSELFSYASFCASAAGASSGPQMIKTLDSSDDKIEKCIADVILCRLKFHLRKLLQLVLQTSMKEVFAENWLSRVAVKPPWVLSDMFHCICHQWKEVFSHLYTKKVKYRCLYLREKIGKKTYGHLLDEVLEIIKNATNLCRAVSRPTVDDSVRDCVQALDELVDQCTEGLSYISGGRGSVSFLPPWITAMFIQDDAFSTTRECTTSQTKSAALSSLVGSSSSMVACSTEASESVSVDKVAILVNEIKDAACTYYRQLLDWLEVKHTIFNKKLTPVPSLEQLDKKLTVFIALAEALIKCCNRVLSVSLPCLKVEHPSLKDLCETLKAYCVMIKGTTEEIKIVDVYLYTRSDNFRVHLNEIKALVNQLKTIFQKRLDTKSKREDTQSPMLVQNLKELPLPASPVEYTAYQVLCSQSPLASSESRQCSRPEAVEDMDDQLSDNRLSPSDRPNTKQLSHSISPTFSESNHGSRPETIQNMDDQSCDNELPLSAHPATKQVSDSISQTFSESSHGTRPDAIQDMDNQATDNELPLSAHPATKQMPGSISQTLSESSGGSRPDAIQDLDNQASDNEHLPSARETTTQVSCSTSPTPSQSSRGSRPEVIQDMDDQSSDNELSPSVHSTTKQMPCNTSPTPSKSSHGSRPEAIQDVEDQSSDNELSTSARETTRQVSRSTSPISSESSHGSRPGTIQDMDGQSSDNELSPSTHAITEQVPHSRSPTPSESSHGSTPGTIQDMDDQSSDNELSPSAHATTNKVAHSRSPTPSESSHGSRPETIQDIEDQSSSNELSPSAHATTKQVCSMSPVQVSHSVSQTPSEYSCDSRPETIQDLDNQLSDNGLSSSAHATTKYVSCSPATSSECSHGSRAGAIQDMDDQSSDNKLFSSVHATTKQVSHSTSPAFSESSQGSWSETIEDMDYQSSDNELSTSAHATTKQVSRSISPTSSESSHGSKPEAIEDMEDQSSDNKLSPLANATTSQVSLNPATTSSESGHCSRPKLPDVNKHSWLTFILLLTRAKVAARKYCFDFLNPLDIQLEMDYDKIDPFPSFDMLKEWLPMFNGSLVGFIESIDRLLSVDPSDITIEHPALVKFFDNMTRMANQGQLIPLSDEGFQLHAVYEFSTFTSICNELEAVRPELIRIRDWTLGLEEKAKRNKNVQ